MIGIGLDPQNGGTALRNLSRDGVDFRPVPAFGKIGNALNQRDASQQPRLSHGRKPRGSVRFVLASQIVMSKSFRTFLVLFFTCSIPSLMPAGWRATGPYGGSVQIVSVDPLNPKEILAGTRSALLYHSNDSGETWEPLAFPHLYKASIYSIAMDPKQPGVYYVGVVSADAKDGVSGGAGVYRSDDAGKSWAMIDAMKGKSVYALAIWPGDSNVIAAGTNEGVWRTEDGSKTWTRISALSNPEMQWIVSLAYHPANKEILYAGTPHLPWKTADGGKTWHSVHTGLIDDSDVFSIRVDAAQPDRVFASACSGIYCTRNGGALWTKMQGIPGTDRRTHIIAQDPQNAETIYAGTTEGLWKSLNGGLTWTKKSAHSINSMAIDPHDGKTFYLATESSGIIKSTDGGETFQAKNQGFVNRNITQFALSSSAAPAKPNLFATTAYDGDFGGMFRSESGEAWSLVATHRRLLGENIITFAISPDDPKVIWAASYDGLLKSVDGGNVWTRPKTYLEPEKTKAAAKRASVRKGVRRTAAVRPAPRISFPQNSAQIYALRYTGAEGKTLLAATSAGLFASLDGGMYWKELPLGAGRRLAVFHLFVAGGRSAALAAVTSAGLYLSPDGGATWRNAQIPAGEASHVEIYDVALHPTDPMESFAAASSGLFQSRDGGATWTHCTKGLSKGWMNSVAFDPTSPNVLFAAQIGRVFQSEDGGDTWRLFDSDGLDGAWVKHLIAGIGGSDELLAVTRSRGVFTRSEQPAARNHPPHPGR
jgi:photosystem II stability/assembly factor-like uncharacterized protein